MNENEIREYLQQEYNYFIDKFSENRILGTFLIGKANYGFAKDEGDLHFITIYLPTFEELCVTTPHNNHDLSEYGTLWDIREVYQNILSQNIYILELLYSDFIIVTPRYQKLFQELILEKRDQFSQYNMQQVIISAYNAMKKAADENNIFEVIRLYQVAYLYSITTSIMECVHLTNPITIEALNSAILGTTRISPKEMIDSTYTLINTVDDATDEEAKNVLATGITTIINEGITEVVSYSSFIKCLSKTEIEALAAIQNHLVYGTGNISIAKIVDETGISRPVWKNLFTKMEKNNIATVRNEGVKGTYIKMLN